MFPPCEKDDFKNSDFSTMRKGPSRIPQKIEVMLPYELEEQVLALPDMKEYPGISGKCLYLIKKALEDIN